MTSDKRQIQFRGESQDNPTSSELSKKTYQVRVQCSNCEQINDADIPCGVRIEHAECPYCGCPSVELTLAATDFNTMTARRILECIGLPQDTVVTLMDMILNGTVEITQNGIATAIEELEEPAGARPEPSDHEVRDPRMNYDAMNELSNHLEQCIGARLNEMSDRQPQPTLASAIDELTASITSGDDLITDSSDGQVHPGYPPAPTPSPQARLVPGPAGDASAQRAPQGLRGPQGHQGPPGSSIARATHRQPHPDDWDQ